MAEKNHIVGALGLNPGPVCCEATTNPPQSLIFQIMKEIHFFVS